MPDSANIAIPRRLYNAHDNPEEIRRVLASDVCWDVVEGFPYSGVYNQLKPILGSITFIARQCYDVYDEENQYACEFAATEDLVIARLYLSHFLNT